MKDRMYSVLQYLKFPTFFAFYYAYCFLFIEALGDALLRVRIKMVD
jgi:hypothetical protein